MTFNQYINNPYGTSSISAQARESIKASYAEKLDKIYLREEKEFKRVMFKGKKSWFLYIKVPSETIPDFAYDVVIQFVDPDLHTSLYDCEVKFFSNDPAFMYNAYVYDKNNLLINDLKSKLPRVSLNTPSERNPKNIPGYIKSIYFAYLMCRRYGFANKVFFEVNAKEYHKSELLFLVKHASDKLEERKDKEIEIKNKSNKKEKTISQSKFENPTKQVQNKVNNSISITKRTKTVGHGVNKIKTTKTTSRSKRIGHGVNKRK